MSAPTTTTEATTPDPTPPDAGWRSRELASLAAVALTGLVVAVTTSLLVPVLPELTVKLGSTSSATQWLLTSTLLMGAVAVPVVGRLADLYGGRRMLVVAAAALIVGSLVCALSDSLGWLIVGRVITGLSVSAIPLGISLIGSILPARRAATGIALVSATLGIGGAVGLPLAAWVAQDADYHVLFWICVVGGALALAGILAAVTEPAAPRAGRMDYAGAVLLASALVCLLLPLAQATAWHWGNAKTIGLLAAAAVLLVIFVLVERRTASPLVDMVVNARPALLLTNVASMCVGFALFASLIGTAAYVQAPVATGYGFGGTILVSGLCLLPSGIAMLLLSPVSAQISLRFGPKVALSIGASVVALGFLGRIAFTEHLWEIVVWTTVAGAGVGIAFAAMPSLVMKATPANELAAANGLNTLARSMGSSLASAIGGTVLAANTVTLAGHEMPSLSGYRILFAVCAGAALLGALIAALIPTPARDAAPQGLAAAGTA